MTNYLGKQRLTRVLYNYLELSAPEKLAELKRELKDAGEYRKHCIRYRKSRGSEWLNASINFGDTEYRYEIFSFGGKTKTITLRGKKVVFGEPDDIVTEIFSGYAYYNKDFSPITETGDKFSDLLVCKRLQKNKNREASR